MHHSTDSPTSRPSWDTPGHRAALVHRQAVGLIADLINDSGRSVRDVATEAGIMPSRLPRILSGHDVLTVRDVMALGMVLDFMPSDLLRLTEQRLNGPSGGR